MEIPQIRRKEMPPDLRERVSVDDLRGVFIKAQQAALSGHKFDADAEAARHASPHLHSSMRVYSAAGIGSSISDLMIRWTILLQAQSDMYD